MRFLATSLATKRRLVSFVAMLLASTVASGVEAKQPVATTALDYEVRQLSTGSYEITLRFRGDRSGRSTVRIPYRWASAEHAERGIEDLNVLTPGARLDPGDRPELRLVVHRPGARLTLRYRLKQILDGEADGGWPTTYLPILQPAYFEWIGWTTWVVPFDDATRVKVSVRFTNLPVDWRFASSFGPDRRAVAFEGRLQRFRESLFVGGDFRLLSRAVRGGHVVTAVRGAWPFADDALADRVRTIIDGERAFWKDASQPDFLVALMPLSASPGVKSYGGTGLTRSFATWTTPIDSLEQLDGLFTHEYFHTWNAEGLGTLPEPETLGYWFSEGLTDYYTHLLRLRWHLLTLEGYAAAFDDVLQSLAHLKENTLPNAKIGERFFSEGRTIGKLPYWRGMLLAARWDAAIRTSSNGERSLDDAMRALHAEHRRGIEPLDAARIARAMRQAGVSDASGDIDRYVERGEVPMLDDAALTSCIRIETVVDRAFDAGFNAEASLATKRITGVDADGPAFVAGLRDGQKLLTINIARRTDIPASVGIEESDGRDRRVIEYLPLGKPVSRQRAAVRDGLETPQRDACLAALGVPTAH